MSDMVVDRQVLGKPKEKYWVSYIHQRIKKNKNFICFISGPTGSGKSWASLSIAEQLDPEFNVDRVVFNGLSLMNLVNSGQLKKGSVIVFEEAGVEINNKNWASVTNKMLNYLMQTFRHRGFILIMNSPYMDFVDLSTRKLFHAELQTSGINITTSSVRLKPHLIQYSARNSKFYYKRLRVVTKEGTKPVNWWNVDKPSNEIINVYEEKKNAFTQRLNQSILLELTRAEEKKSGIKHLTQIQRETLDMLNQGKSLQEIAQQRGRAYSSVARCLHALRNKGYQFVETRRPDNQVMYQEKALVEAAHNKQ